MTRNFFTGAALLLAVLHISTAALANWSVNGDTAVTGRQLPEGKIAYLGVSCEPATQTISVFFTGGAGFSNSGPLGVAMAFDGKVWRSSRWYARKKDGMLIFSTAAMPRNEVMSVTRKLKAHSTMTLGIQNAGKVTFSLKGSSQSIKRALSKCSG